MISARHFQSFCLHPDERSMFAATLSGQIATIDVDRFEIVNELQAHVGGIHAITCHRRLPYLAALSTDRSVSIWRIDNPAGHLSKIASMSFRSLRCDNDDRDVPFIQSTSQALAFHDREPRLLTRTGSGGLLELGFDDEHCNILRCERFTGDEDLVQARYLVGSDAMLLMANYGTVILVENGRPVRKWKFGHHNVHWAEHVEDSVYLLASDTLSLVRLDVSGVNEPLIGPRITLDDLEHVTINRRSARAFVGSFDGRVYEVDPSTCRSLGVVYRAPFKCRWVKSLERDPSVLLVQCRNGSLHKVDLESGQRRAMIKETPNALWSADVLPGGDIVVAGDADAFFRIHISGVDGQSRIPSFEIKRLPVPVETEVHTKRIVVHQSSGKVLLARNDGDLWVNEGTRFGRIFRCGSAIRDVATHPIQPVVFACTEDGHVYRLNLDSGQVEKAFTSSRHEPIWALSYNPQKNLLAFAEREGSLFVVTADNLELVREVRDLRRCKRMKWVDENTLFYGRSTELYRLDLVTGFHSLHVAETGNTIEDFIWDREKRYLVLINYNSLVILCDFATGAFVDVTPDQMDYTKGLVWLDPATRLDLNLYPLDFLSFGRGGWPFLYRIHDEKCLPLGAIPGDRLQRQQLVFHEHPLETVA